ncbi:MAG: hypothetical protein FWH52_06540, partial [Synergistaceae bacterium]|nr:hypothetical protein [Synergistaceae bacterium]
MKFLLKLTLLLGYFISFSEAYASSITEYPNILQIDFYPSGAMFTFECQTDLEGDFETILPSCFTQITEWKIVPILRPEWVPP